MSSLSSEDSLPHTTHKVSLIVERLEFSLDPQNGTLYTQVSLILH